MITSAPDPTKKTLTNPDGTPADPTADPNTDMSVTAGASIQPVGSYGAPDPATPVMPSVGPQAPMGPRGLPLPSSTDPAAAPSGLAPTDRSTSMLETQNAPSFAPMNTQQTPPPVSDAPPMTTPAPTIQSVGTTAPPQYTGPAAQADMPNSPFDPNTPQQAPTISGLSEADKNLYWAGQGAINPTTTLGLPANASQADIQAATQAYLAKNKAAIDAVTQKVHGGDAANLAAQNTAVQTFDDNQNKAAYGALATALNGQQGLAGSGDAYLDPNAPTPGFLGTGPSLGQGGAAPATIANPLDAAHTPTPGSQHPDATFTQTGPTSQGGTQTQTSGPPVPGITQTTGTPNVSASTQQQTGSDLHNYDQNTNLLGTEIDPTASQRLSTMQGQVDKAATNLSTAPDRQALAQQSLDAFDQSFAPQLRDQLRAVGQRAAAVGRLGMGDTSVEQLQPYTDYLTQRSALAKQLASETAGQKLSDNINTLGALNSTEGSTASQEALNRGELRSERSFQSGMDQQALENAINQYQLEQQTKNTDFNQNLARAGILNSAGGTAGSSAGLDFNALASLLAPYLNQQKPAGG